MTRQRLTIEADAVFVEEHNYWQVTGSDGSQTFIPAWAVTDAEPLTEPLPTEPGTVIVATVTRRDKTWRGPVMRDNTAADEACWASPVEVDAMTWHESKYLSDWQVMYRPEATP